jgi:penicillin-binding protein 1C
VKFWNYIKRPLKWTWRKKYYFTAISSVVIFIIWLFCTPDKFFNDPTCTILTNAEGQILNARIADDGQWRFPPRKDVPHKFEQAILQFEDRGFQSHWGFSFSAFGRAMKQNISAGRVVSGGSTITMQVVRLSRKGQDRKYTEKIVEVFQATRMEWTYSKEEILAMYASYAPMGGNVVGIDAASWRYFGRKADELSWAESCMLAVLPNAPSLLHLDKNRSKLLAKRNRLMDRLYEVEIITENEWKLGKTEELPTAPPDLPNLAPHLIDKAIANGKKGQWISTHIDIFLQSEVTKIIEYHHQRLKENEIHNAAAVVLNIKTGKVIAYVGNTVDYSNEHGSYVDVITAPRSTGSILKPYLYATILEDGMITPNQLIEDVPMIISGYAPKNYNMKYDGAVPAQRALSRSLNVPIVKLLKEYGVQRFHQKLRDIGMTTITRPSSDYGLSLILGGAEASLWDLCSIYGNMANTLNNYATQTPNSYQPYTVYTEGNTSKSFHQNVTMNPAAIWSTFEAMIAVARPEEDGQWQQFKASQKIAWKTGTSYGFRDAWAIGTTSDYVVGVWVGNADGEGRPGLIGSKAAAPILFDIFERLPSSEWFEKPYDEMKSIPICRQSGFKASDICPDVDSVFVPSKCENAKICPHHKRIHLDATETYRVNSTCASPADMTTKAWFVLPPIMEKFYRAKNPSYKPLPPYKSNCEFNDELSPLDIIYPKPGSNIYVPIKLDGEQSMTVFEASHVDASQTIYWHLDDNYLGETKDIHQMELAPEIGEHIFTLIDENGYQVTRRFNVVGK